ncbi:MAG TPA: hypothetical protein DIS90_15160, partial [Cytophagales bacterium]|nr:hypothetical protein [Cytophagales bacterium]
TNSAGTATQTVSFVCELPKDENPEKEEVEESKDKDSDKITICHKPPGNRENSQTLTISKSAWPAHEKHGDTIGPCKD